MMTVVLRLRMMMRYSQIYDRLMDGQGTECLKLFYNLREMGKGGDSFLAIQKSQMPDDSWTLFSTRLDPILVL